MEPVLHELNASLVSTIQRMGEKEHILQRSLHNTDSLPDKNLLALVDSSLNLLSEVRYLLEPGHLILADHYLGMSPSRICFIDPNFDRIHKHESTLCCGRAQHP